ncbi:uncharacterized protein LOC131679200 [Topomyia yanbarensis]|uniref:uncharacterized protein LOC131679200 n=1 Tax=Topomyia yanbarensis TaxID=2498891 RepID=UPI00273AA32F|nr:uncharacterized protein LOC131679200 [Topomyia yanbarensis]XP_058815838.1 uncharacterized protein LOC131679200 [Topomyia yanbarensis]
MEPTAITTGKQPRTRFVKKPTSYTYDSKNEGLPVYGVIVQWDSNEKYSNKALITKFEAKLTTYRSAVERDVLQKKSIRKNLPYFRRVGPNKGIVSFKTMAEANAFSKTEDSEFYAFIPLSFIVVVGVAEVSASNFNFKDFRPVCPKHEVMQWRKKKLPSTKKIQITVAIRGTQLPSMFYFKKNEVPLNPLERKPVYCCRCLRYGHRVGNCMRKPRCGVCIRTKPALKHREQHCYTIKRGNIERCLYCQQNHIIGTADCVEHVQQCTFKAQLVKRSMDYVSVLASDIIPAIRTTSVNSTRSWLEAF